MKIEQFGAEVLLNVGSEVERRFTSIDDPAHGWEHVQRVYNLALHIARQEEADRFIVGMAALMHDLGRTSHDESVHHADMSVYLATEILHTYQVPPATQEAILHAIVTHSFSKNIEPRTIEARVVRDADRLDSIGAIGILRLAITGTLRRTPQTRSYHPDDPFAEHHTPDDHIYMLDHFYTKLLRLHETMATETGRQMAQRRTEFLQSYLDELRDEIDS